MLRKRWFAILILVACGAILLLGFNGLIQLTIIRYGGEKVSVVIVKVPVNCDKYNHIKVQYKGSVYEVNISRTDCREGIYRPGDTVVLLKHPDYEEFAWPGQRPEWVIVILLAVFTYVFFSARKSIRKQKSRAR